MGRKSKADQRRTEIIEAFYHCVTQEGIAGASIRKIAAKARVQPSVLHHYFAGRDEIIEEAVVYFTDRIFQEFTCQMAAAGRQKDLEKSMAFIFSKGMINDDYTGFFLECCVAARHNPKIKETLADLFRRFRLAIEDQLSGLSGFDSLPEDEKQLLSSTIVALHEGMELQWFADPSAVSLKRAQDVTKKIVGYFIKAGEHLS